MLFIISPYVHSNITNANKSFEKNGGRGYIGIRFLGSYDCTALRKNWWLRKKLEFVLLDAKELEIMKASEVFERSCEIFTSQEGSGLSFVDASNLACMERRRIRKIATFDKDFLGRSEVEVVSG